MTNLTEYDYIEAIILYLISLQARLNHAFTTSGIYHELVPAGSPHPQISEIESISTPNECSEHYTNILFGRAHRVTTEINISLKRTSSSMRNSSCISRGSLLEGSHSRNHSLIQGNLPLETTLFFGLMIQINLKDLWIDIRSSFKSGFQQMIVSSTL
jgi:hypothetical protein